MAFKGPFHLSPCGWWACQTNRVRDWMYTRDRNKDNSSSTEFMLSRFRINVQVYTMHTKRTFISCVHMLNPPTLNIPSIREFVCGVGGEGKRQADRKKGYVCPMSTDLKYSLCFVYIDRPSQTNVSWPPLLNSAKFHQWRNVHRWLLGL